MSRLTKQTGWIATLFLLSNLVWAASFDTPPLLKPSQLLLRNKVNLPPLTTIRPALTRVTPSGCTSPGGRLVLGGRNLGQRGRRQLVMDTGQTQVTLGVISWTASRITTRLPRRFNHRGKVEIGIRSNRRWLSTPLPVVICAAIRVPVPTGIPVVSAPVRGITPPSSPLPTTPVSTPAPAEPSSPVTPSPAASPDLSAPTSPPADYTWSNPPGDTEQIPPARQIGGGTLLGAALPPVPASLQLAVPPPQGAQRQYAPHELVAVTASMKDAMRLAQVMGRYQARVIRRRKLGSLGMVMSAFRLPEKVKLLKMLSTLRAQYPDLWIDVNHYFRPQTTPNSPRTSLYHAIGWHSGQHCGRRLRIGILDGPVDMSHPVLSGQAVVQKRLFARGRTVASTDHATAVASLLVGNPAVPGLGGIINEAHLYVGVVMQAGDDDDQYSTAEDLLSGLNWLLEQRVQVISLSLGGRSDALLEVALQRTLARGVGVVAAAGNGGAEASPSYPAAQTGVVAVTSVDSDDIVARDANRGNYIDLAAPGVDVWVAASRGGGRYASGTSMAAPLVAAALAQLGGKPAQATHLFQQARDLGKMGKDPVYGWGLLQFPACSGT